MGLHHFYLIAALREDWYGCLPRPLWAGKPNTEEREQMASATTDTHMPTAMSILDGKSNLT